MKEFPLANLNRDKIMGIISVGPELEYALVHAAKFILSATVITSDNDLIEVHLTPMPVEPITDEYLLGLRDGSVLRSRESEEKIVELQAENKRLQQLLSGSDKKEPMDRRRLIKNAQLPCTD